VVGTTSEHRESNPSMGSVRVRAWARRAHQDTQSTQRKRQLPPKAVVRGTPLGLVEVERLARRPDAHPQTPVAVVGDRGPTWNLAVVLARRASV